jgi:hypothetical protein
MKKNRSDSALLEIQIYRSTTVTGGRSQIAIAALGHVEGGAIDCGRLTTGLY